MFWDGSGGKGADIKRKSTQCCVPMSKHIPIEWKRCPTPIKPGAVKTKNPYREDALFPVPSSISGLRFFQWLLVILRERIRLNTHADSIGMGPVKSTGPSHNGIHAIGGPSTASA